ncbi:MAG: transglycosylase domain-containing protein, partial [Chloroflexia bacterium]|nr:transglycosylase domain-containing protein [Chloroflexia bacterium]
MSIHHVRLQRRRRSNSSNQANGAKVPPFVLKKLVPSSASVSPRRFPMVLKLLIVGLVLFGLLGLSAIGVAAGVYFNYARQLEGMLVPLETRILSETTKIYDRNGYLLYEIFEEGRRTRLTSLEQVPEALIEATIAVEDKTFFTNPGVDPQGILRAAILILQSGEIQGGGSTLTQQFIRNALFPPEERYAQTMDRKIKEGILSLELTRTYSKEEILLMFFNEISYGNLAYGVEAAAQSYFGKHVWELDLAECAFLAGLPQSPTGYNPFFEGGLERSRARQWDVLNLMAENDFITRAQADAAYNEELHFEAPVISIEAPHFVMYVRQLLEQDPEIGIDKLYGGGLSVYTTLDIRYQRLAEAIIRDWLDPYELNPEHQNMRDYNVNNGAMVVMRPDTGEILAMVGSVDYNLVKPSRCGRETNVVDGNVNAALALRQPGSSFKPFTYLNAFLKGWAPSTMVLDVRTEFPVPGHPAYEPHNHDNKFHGPLSVRVALGSSENVPAVKAIQFAGVGETIDLAHQMGIKGLGDPSFYGLSLTLGGGEVRLLDMVTAYGTLANAGRYVPNQSILRI